ncbi:NADH-quinone oxidoreductase subunit NuoK [Acidiphilium sp. AL]|uniref:NADH-quinone oxidoreductase subunit K n=1 Tax=Acidiphilium iwatense TaxID=768198 RepID=A0ABS9DWN9_9PROT|nr:MULTISPECIES: NADH-quinone oxidoreductase subunit NuoK [Acidiphilium]MCF3947149.1 NADH-quinone oxidoreductase subunit NuoK [Acidiphilium iwatense]MCU4160632.1 NADH-quinone oxidoreductase subunit NuoK [Acidiphilium sp. AL]
MTTIPLDHVLILPVLLFALGVIGVLVRRNLVFILMSIEIMLNAAGLMFIIAGARWGQPDGQVMFLLVLTLAAAEVSVGLALIIRIRHRLTTLDSDAADLLQG